MNPSSPPAITALRRRVTATAAVMLMLWSGAALPAAAQDSILQGLRGEQLKEADLAQGATIFIVWASWSPHSRDVVERVNRVAQRWNGKARVVTVNFQEERGVAEGFLAGKGLGAPVFLDPDGSFSKKYAMAWLPGLLIIKDGRVAYRGKLPEDPDRVIVEILG
ncbi:MAG TPA: TlpA disulfide reductase family protein [Thermoanaerobaculia bacterium]|nr:TlpA disulfide reductase family protein [Thermoanaerobaculia bacterium]